MPQKLPKGWIVGGMIDVASTAKELQTLWARFEERFPVQVGSTPAMRGRKAIFYSTNGKSRRTKCIRLFEHLALELGSLAGDVREVERTPDNPPPSKTKSKKR